MKTAPALAPPAPPAEPPTSYRLTVPNGATAPGVARDLVAALLRSTGHPQLVEAARLCTSEAMTNVHRHAPRTRLVHVEVSVGSKGVTVCVVDDEPHLLPEPQERFTDQERGLGLYLICTCSDAWGVTLRGGLIAKTKSVWFRLDEGGRGVA
ncbi:ATP-binding protein [Streptomyces sp. ASQP_92]|uniref:ATP-binding protein n=1 Tax=Streptomyces sp. ASQP_92 TaxID=2979116 RepID=UPI0021C17ACB|nr:ATP-binding protein [Streptomyces sp. ASQP_92]MCT9090575.1 ATP-binding protein [Streptomyces sp. ASQP_92]